MKTSGTISGRRRVYECLRHAIDNGGVSVWYHPTRKRATYHGLQRCGSVWLCPNCSAKIQEVRKAELVTAVAEWHKRHGGLGMATLTFPHYRADDLAELLEKLDDAIGKLFAQRAFKDAKRDFGIAYHVKCQEVNHGVNGWHPHFHILFFFTGGIQTAEKLSRLQEVLFELWANACVSSGLPKPSVKYGVDVRDGTKAAEYISKWGHEQCLDTVKKEAKNGIANELVKATCKKGRNGSRSPWQLLIDAHNGDRHARALFKIYADAYKGRRQLTWSRGLKKLLGVGEKSDQEVADEMGEGMVKLLDVPRCQWLKICAKELRGDLLTVSGPGDLAVARAWLREHAEPEPELKPERPPPPKVDYQAINDARRRAKKLDAPPSPDEDLLA